MRTTMFGDAVIESIDDDLGLEVDTYGTYAIIRKDEDGSGKYAFEILDNEDGEQRATSESIFDDEFAARSYLRGWFPSKDIQT